MSIKRTKRLILYRRPCERTAGDLGLHNSAARAIPQCPARQPPWRPERLGDAAIQTVYFPLRTKYATDLRNFFAKVVKYIAQCF